ERDVPAPPELPRVERAVRMVEVLGKPEPEHPGETERNVGVAREVEVDLKRIRVHGEPNLDGRGEADVAVHPADEHAEGIGQDDLLHQPPQDEECAALDGLQAYAAGGFDLRPEQAPATDRSCDELREEGDVERVFPERVARRAEAAVRIGDGGCSM